MSSDRVVSLPQHVNPAGEQPATAPYNFVPLPEVVVRAVDHADDLPDHSSFADESHPHTGYFEVTLTTKSPLYVRCALARDRFDVEEPAHTPYADRARNTPEFFYRDDPDQPVIPGSSLRGMLRALLEIVSYGKIERVFDRHLIYRAVGDRTALGAWYRRQMLGGNKLHPPTMRFDYPVPQLKGGYLESQGGTGAIRPAVEHKGESFVHVEYGRAQAIGIGSGSQQTHPVLVEPAARAGSPRPARGRRPPLTLDLALTPRIQRRGAGAAPPGLVPATLVESGGLPGKHMHCAIYEPDATAAPIPIPDDLWNAYVEDRYLTRGIPTRPLCNGGDPLFYLLDGKGDLVFFGPTMMFRLPYRRGVHDLIPAELRDPLAVDFADALFGFVRQKSAFPPGALPPQGSKRRAYAGRVAVTDATLAAPVPPEQLWLLGAPGPALTPKILSTPKPTSFQHYLAQPKGDRGKADLSFYDSPKPDDYGQQRGAGTVIRGHKLYWHQGLRTAGEIQEAAAPDPTSTQHTRMKPVQAGVRFRFRVYFENLSDAELGALCWVLHPVGPAQEYCHSLGMGKPLGLGAVKLDAALHLTDRKRRYARLFVPLPAGPHPLAPSPTAGGEGVGGTARWETGEEGEPQRDLEALAEPFERHILGVLRTLGVAPTAARLHEVPRIGMLLTMLEWEDHPPAARAQGMTPQQFQPRPVLPDPTYYRQQPAARPATPGGTSRGDGPAPSPPPPPTPSPKPLDQPVVRGPVAPPSPVPPKSTVNREKVTVVKAGRPPTAQVQTEAGEVVVCTGFPPSPGPEPGKACRADVYREAGKPVQATFKGWISPSSG